MAQSTGRRVMTGPRWGRGGSDSLHPTGVGDRTTGALTASDRTRGAGPSLRAALDRLTHTAVGTNIRAEGKKKFASFHWLESWTELTDDATGETLGMTITIPEWLFNGVVMKGGILTIHEGYFLLTGGIERWLYRVARKHAGAQPLGWSFTMRQLFDKFGSCARFSDFAGTRPTGCSWPTASGPSEPGPPRTRPWRPPRGSTRGSGRCTSTWPTSTP
ncbi:MAG: replication initiator protein A, partial [Zavarzinella sp.]|nr:replication initiator protein A [Zavarzinella sp.]